MRYYVNTSKAVINIGGHTMIAPTKAAAVDVEVRGVKDLIDRGLLVETEAPPEAKASKKRGNADDTSDGAKEPTKVAELKKWLDDQGAQYDASASKAELQGLYEALKASRAEQANGGDQNGAGATEQ
ncbi:hypothetical protein [Bordetella hinzii]|uniref:hypothetical protein n=1 Tax=Bordetella hinzii TaxID=103855 RepID=UPI00114E5710|nr:hypothetical protein [Bordetella hinzii]QDJ52813.1 hypothetical protein CBR69_22080 [Bordetella hinzii]